MARMLGRAHVQQCPYCRRPPGPDCPGWANPPTPTNKVTRAREHRGWRRWWRE